MPVEFLSDEQVAAYGRFDGSPSRAELERFFFLDEAARELIAGRRGDANRLGFAVQLGAVRFLGTFLADPLEVPWEVVEYVAGQVGITDAWMVKAYTERDKTPLELDREPREVLVLRGFGGAEAELRGFLSARAWTRSERGDSEVDHAVNACAGT
jgi:hypothetical protein